MRAINARDELTQREIDEFEHEKEIAQLQAEYQLKFKEMELELKKIDVQWSQVFRLPFAILTLPVRILFGFGYIAHAIRGTTPSDKFWAFIEKL